MAASSPYDNAAVIVRTPVTTQAISSQPGLPSCLAIAADTMKIPDPIIDPVTTMVESNNPSSRLNVLSRLVGLVVSTSAIERSILCANSNSDKAIYGIRWPELQRSTDGEVRRESHRACLWADGDQCSCV